MDRIDTDTKAVDLFGAGKHGFRDGNLALSVLPTDFDAEWCNAQQEEKMSIIEGAGVVPAIGNFTQLRQALKRMFGGNLTTVNGANTPFALGADHAGLVIMDGTVGNVVANLPAANVLAVPLKYRFVRFDATANTATVNCAGADTLPGVGTSFTLLGLGDFRAIESDAVSKWAALSVAPPAGVKPGTIFIWAGTSAPADSLLCPTSATTVSRTTYAALFAAIGTQWGAGDGATTFGIPWFPANYAAVQANANVGSSTTGQVISHDHTLATLVAFGGASNLLMAGSGSQGATTSGATGATGGAANLAAGQRTLFCVQY